MRILVIDDDINLGKVISYQLKQQGYEVDTAVNGRDGLKYFKRSEYDIIVCDIQMPDISGIDVLKEVRKRNQQIIFLIITAYGSVENAVEACNLGADDYLTKPFGKEQLLFSIEKSAAFRTLQKENLHLHRELRSKFKFENMVAASGPMKEVLRVSERLANSTASVLVLGESGTGKELIARNIHYSSSRKDKPFIVVNCPSIPDNLLESELFGHVKGAFTGAVSDRMGKFEQADGGTIFLDEIGDLHLDLQAKLLRVLQEQEFDRVGGSKTIKVDVRVITATNQNLELMVKEKKFREDLYYRLNVIPITIPPLRDRKEDIPFLADFFCKRICKDKKIKLSSKIFSAFQQYHWPGNVRELENIVERMVTLAAGEEITIHDLPDYILNPIGSKIGFGISIPKEGIALEDIEKSVVEEVLRRAEGNQSQAARLLKIPRHVLLYKIKKLGIAAQKS